MFLKKFKGGPKYTTTLLEWKYRYYFVKYYTVTSKSCKEWFLLK